MTVEYLSALDCTCVPLQCICTWMLVSVCIYVWVCAMFVMSVYACAEYYFYINVCVYICANVSILYICV